MTSHCSAPYWTAKCGKLYQPYFYSVEFDDQIRCCYFVQQADDRQHAESTETTHMHCPKGRWT